MGKSLIHSLVNLDDENTQRIWLEELRQALTIEDNHYVGAAGEPAFNTGAGWGNYTTYSQARFYKDPFGRVHLSGYVAGGASGSTIFTLPDGYLPEKQCRFTIEIETSGAGHGPHAHVQIETTGVISTTFNGGGTATYLMLDGISFRAV